MPITTNADARIQGLHAIVLENDWLQVSILPEVGAKIYDLVCKRTAKNFLWHNPRIIPQPYPIDANFDNYWCGGWDEGFPTCDECDFAGEHYPNLDELRSVRWTVESVKREGEDAVARLSAYGPISPIRAEKAVTLAGQRPMVRMRYQITNLGPLPLDFIWGTHPALDPTPHMMLRVPARTGIVGQASNPTLGRPGQRYAWPILEGPAGTTDVSRVQGIDAKAFCGHYATDLDAGWYAVEDAETGEGFLLELPADICPYLWMWLVYGGWRGYHHVILEPWTSYPVNLAEAVRQKTNRRLEPGETFSVEVRAMVYTKPETWQEALGRTWVAN
jgi:galactose mutarotase-like enzyme